MCNYTEAIMLFFLGEVLFGCLQESVICCGWMSVTPIINSRLQFIFPNLDAILQNVIIFSSVMQN